MSRKASVDALKQIRVLSREGLDSPPTPPPSRPTEAYETEKDQEVEKVIRGVAARKKEILDIIEYAMRVDEAELELWVKAEVRELFCKVKQRIISYGNRYGTERRKQLVGALNSMMSMEDAVLEAWMDTCEYHIAHLDTIKNQRIQW